MSGYMSRSRLRFTTAGGPTMTTEPKDLCLFSEIQA